MKYCEFLHTKRNILQIIFISYLEGYSIEEIMWRLQQMYGINLNINEINEILDYLILSNY